MHEDSRRDARDRHAAREIHELTYWKHLLGVSENTVRNAIEKVGNNRAKLERELKRLGEHAQ